MSVNKVKKINRTFNEKRIPKDIFAPVPIDVRLVSNPFLKDNEKYLFLVYKIKQYNQAVIKGLVTDSYHAMVQDRLNSLLVTLANLLTRDLQIEKLNQIYEWFMKQEKLIEQRKNQGDIRYKITKDFLEQKPEQISPKFVKSQNFKKLDYNTQIPSQIIANQNLPYLKKWRTTHKQLQIPEIRLRQYNRKSLNFNPIQFSTQKQVKKSQKIKYPKLQRLKYNKQYQIQEAGPQQANKNESVVLNPQNPQNGQKKEGQQPTNPQNPVQQPPQQPQVQDLGLGQQPQQQPEQQQQQQEQDKLAPKLKSYTFQPRVQGKQQIYSHKRMNERYLKLQNDYIKKQKQDGQFIEMMHSWAARKSQLDKQIMKRIQNMGISYDKYKFSHEDPQKQQIFSAQDAKKYGLNKTFDVRKSQVQLDLSQGFELPSIKNKSDIFQKSIRKDKLAVLKKKFGKMLNIKDQEQREIVQSMCQATQNKKGFSQILRKHSKSKQRLKQLDQVFALKQKLAREKISVDITALSMSICAPQDQQNNFQGMFPAKNLISNPFWVQPAKKKKKKK